MFDTQKTVEEMVLEALEEATILEYGRSTFDLKNVFAVAEKLSGVPYSWIMEVHERNKKNVCSVRG